MFFLPRSVKIALAAVLLSAGPAAAEMELSLYLGWQSTDDSTASGTLPGGVAFSRNIDWEAKPFEGPIYYGGRAIWWTERDFGFGLEGTHTKAYASAADLAALGLNRFELSDGNNIFTANAMKRWPGLFNGVNGAVGRGPDRGRLGEGARCQDEGERQEAGESAHVEGPYPRPRGAASRRLDRPPTGLFILRQPRTPARTAGGLRSGETPG